MGTGNAKEWDGMQAGRHSQCDPKSSHLFDKWRISSVIVKRRAISVAYRSIALTESGAPPKAKKGESRPLNSKQLFGEP